MENRYILEEQLEHGTALFPFSLHYITINAHTENILYLHWHKEFEFLIVVDGGALFHIEDRCYEVHKEEGIFIPSNYLHSATSLNGLPCTFYAFVFDSYFITDNRSGALYSNYVKPVLTGKVHFVEHYGCKDIWQKQAFSLLLDMSRLYGNDLCSFELIIKSRILELWHLFFHHPCIEKYNTSAVNHYSMERLKPILEFIHGNYQQDISLQMLANRIPISESQFCRSFKEAVGVSPFTYLIRYRILMSCALLINSDDNITNIANQIGFNNISYFNREFKTIIGCTPSDYRKNKKYSLN